MNKERMDELFTKACKGVIKQGKQSEKNGTCVYRGEGNLKCAVGHMIPDKMYNEKMEYNSFVNLCDTSYSWVTEDFAKHFGYDSTKEMTRYLAKKGSSGHISGHIFGQLQDIHDGCPNGPDFVKDFKRYALSLARKYKLKKSVEYLTSI